MGWKIFAIVNAILVGMTIFGPRSSAYSAPFEIFSILISIPAAIGLALYAFNRLFLTPSAWRIFSWLFAAYSIGIIGLFLKQLVDKVAGGAALLPIAGALAIVVALQFFNWLALHRLGMGETVAARRPVQGS